MPIKNFKQSSKDINGVYIRLASPEKSNVTYTGVSGVHKRRYWGEVTKVETLNYRTYKPEMGGLFCEKIFGPTKDWECHCEKYKTIRYNGIVCDKCGVEITEKSVRRYRMGYIQLAIPIVHLWYFRSLSNKIGLLLGINTKNLEKIVYYERYVVIQAGLASEFGVKNMDLLSDDEYWALKSELSADNNSLSDDNPHKFIAKMGGEAIEILLKQVNIETLYNELKEKGNSDKSLAKRNEILKRLKVVAAFKESNENGKENKPEWMVMRILPVIPAGLRPLVQLDGGKLATSDFNELYRRVIIRNNRLSKLVEAKAPDIILRNEKRMLQESVDGLIEKSQGKEREGKVELKSLSDNLKGKQGLFRQNLLGKRVDYSGRSVIVVGPELKLHECGLPKDMAVELYKPFIIRKLIERRIVETVKSAKKLIAKKTPVVWEVLESILKGHPVLLNRAPTLHRLSIQAFQPILIEGKAIQLHPLLCTAFNADFDGDQMAVHVPLSAEAIVESSLLLLSSQNIFNPANGRAITLPSKDMVLGVYYITKLKISGEVVRGNNMIFYSSEEVLLALNSGKIDVHANIKVRIEKFTESGVHYELVETTPGRVKFNQFVPSQLGFVNELITGKRLQQLVSEVYSTTDTVRTVQFLDDIKKLGFESAYEGGISISLEDVKVPAIKYELIKAAQEEIEEVLACLMRGILVTVEFYNKLIDIWTDTILKISYHVNNVLRIDQGGFNPLHMMADSGARGSKEQIRQIAGIRGLMTKPQKSLNSSSDSIIETPIIPSFKEGLSVTEYFISTHGARKGLADTALKTADAGYLTRRLVEVSQNVVVTESDCGTVIGIRETALEINDEIIETLAERVQGRVALANIYAPKTNEILCSAGQEISYRIAKKFDEVYIKEIEVRSTFTCQAKKGVCAKCYGVNLATGRLTHIGDAVGIIAAQSIGEPGTQLTLRTFHVGGVAANIAVESKVFSKYDGVVEFKDLKSVEINDTSHEKVHIVLSRSCELKVLDPNTQNVLSTRHIPYGTYLRVKEGETVKKDQELCYWDPYNGVILAERDGQIVFESIEEGVTFSGEYDEQIGNKNKVIIESKNRDKHPSITLITNTGEALRYNIPVKAHLLVEDSQTVYAGQVLCKIPRIIGKSRDITGGLPRVTELLEVRTPANTAVLAEIEGEVSYGLRKGNFIEVYIESKHGVRKKYMLPLSKHILVQPNDYVRAGDRLSEGIISLMELLEIRGLIYIQKYLVNELQEVYRLQGVKINDKHMEVVIGQMMTKVEIVEAGDTVFVQGQLVDRVDFKKENDAIIYKKIVIDAGDSKKIKVGQILSVREVDNENSSLLSEGLKPLVFRGVECATAKPKLQGITKTSLSNDSFLSAASFQEATKVLSDASLRGEDDSLSGLKESVIVGKLIPAGTGFNKNRNFSVFSIREQMEDEWNGELESKLGSSAA
jgi:DNA-directed RNA polymerase subunit beta'